MGSVTKAFGGKALITFHDVKHFYTVSCPGIFKGQLYQPSVTSVIGMKDKSAALVSWATTQFAERMHGLIPPGTTLDSDSVSAVVDVAKDTWRRSKDQAADIGSLAHRVFESALKGEVVETPLRYDAMTMPNFTQEMVDQANHAIDAGLSFIREHEIKLVEAEAPRWSPTHGYIGTGDLVAYIDGKLSLADWKTSKRLYPTVRLQLSAYKHAYEEEHPEHFIEQRVAINTGKDGSLTVEYHDDYTHENDFKTFLALLDVWRWDRENQGQWSKPAPRRLTPAELELILPSKGA